MVADILGFSKLINNLPDHLQSGRINEWIDLVNETSREIEVRETQLISDSLFVIEENSESGLERLLKFAQLLITKGVDKSFPIRGAITHGNVSWGQLTYGKAVLQAYEFERSLEWIGVACSPQLPDIASMWNWDLVAVYPAPRKSGKVILGPAVVWDVPLSESLLAKVTGGGSHRDGDYIEWDVIAKVERTLQFGLYVRLARKFGLQPSTFSGGFPMQAIESVVLDRLVGEEA